MTTQEQAGGVAGGTAAKNIKEMFEQKVRGCFFPVYYILCTLQTFPFFSKSQDGTAPAVGGDDAVKKKGATGSIIVVRSERCHVCNKAVYFNDKLQADGLVFHKST